MKTYLSVILCWLCLSLPSSAGGSRKYAAVDRYALAAPAAAERDVKSLAQYLGKGPAIHGDEDKARAIYRWVTDRIAYDVPAYASHKIPDQSPSTILQRRTGVCQGYAELYRDIAREAGLEVKLIGGEGKTMGGRESHAWDLVKLDGHWRLLDPTWGAGSCDATTFHQGFSDYWFLTPPEELILSHYPSDARFQLVSPNWTKSQFVTHANVFPSFFSTGLTLSSHVRAVIHARETLLVTLFGPVGLELTASLERHGKRALLPCCKVTQEATSYGRIRYKIETRFPTVDTYRLSIFAAPPGRSRLDAVLEYQVKADRAMPDFNSFPTAFSTVRPHEGCVAEPERGVLWEGAQQEFHFHFPGATEASIDNEGHHYELSRHGEDFSATLRPKAGKLDVFAHFANNPSVALMEGLFQYQVWKH
jgi:hypothetical protein